MGTDARILEGVERIHWCTTGVLCFPGAFGAVMRYLGEDVSSDFAMGVSGGAFKTFWLPPWAYSNCDLLVIGEEPIRRAFTAAGYGYTFTPDFRRSARPHDETWYRERIVASIDAGVPVIAQGVIGPPEASVIAGYEDGGAVLFGTSYFQEQETGYFRAEGWYGNIFSLLVVGEKGERPSPRQTLASSLEWAIHLARTPAFDGLMDPDTVPSVWHASGLAAWDAMADALTRETEWPADMDAETLDLRCCAVGNDGVHLRPSQREAAARFLTGYAQMDLPGADALCAAADAYNEESAVLQEAHARTPYSMQPEESRRRLLDRANRQAIARVIREARQVEERAVSHLERALAALKE